MLSRPELGFRQAEWSWLRADFRAEIHLVFDRAGPGAGPIDMGAEVGQ